MKFRKKPIVIEAVQHTNEVNRRDILDFVPPKSGRFRQDSKFEIYTLEGTMLANVGDWIIKGVKGEFYPCKPDIFEATYEAVED